MIGERKKLTYLGISQNIGKLVTLCALFGAFAEVLVHVAALQQCVIGQKSNFKSYMQEQA